MLSNLCENWNLIFDGMGTMKYFTYFCRVTCLRVACCFVLTHTRTHIRMNNYYKAEK